MQGLDTDELSLIAGLKKLELHLFVKVPPNEKPPASSMEAIDILELPYTPRSGRNLSRFGLGVESSRHSDTQSVGSRNLHRSATETSLGSYDRGNLLLAAINDASHAVSPRTDLAPEFQAGSLRDEQRRAASDSLIGDTTITSAKLATAEARISELELSLSNTQRRMRTLARDFDIVVAENKQLRLELNLPPSPFAYRHKEPDDARSHASSSSALSRFDFDSVASTNV